MAMLADRLANPRADGLLDFRGAPKNAVRRFGMTRLALSARKPGSCGKQCAKSRNWDGCRFRFSAQKSLAKVPAVEWQRQANQWLAV